MLLRRFGLVVRDREKTHKLFSTGQCGAPILGGPGNCSMTIMSATRFMTPMLSGTPSGIPSSVCVNIFLLLFFGCRRPTFGTKKIPTVVWRNGTYLQEPSDEDLRMHLDL